MKLENLSTIHAQVPNPGRYNNLSRAFDVVSFFMGGFHYSGAENLPRTPESYLIVPNHDNMFEVTTSPKALLAASGEHAYVPSKNAFWRYPLVGGFVGSYIESVGGIAVDRSKDITAQRDVEEQVDELVRKRAILVWFFQMTRRNHKKGEVPIRSLKTSSALLIAKHNLQVVPTGTAGRSFPYVHFAEPFSFNAPPFDTSDRKQNIEIRETILKPAFRDEVQPRMQDAADRAKKERQAIIAASIAKRVLWRALHPLGE